MRGIEQGRYETRRAFDAWRQAMISSARPWLFLGCVLGWVAVSYGCESYLEAAAARNCNPTATDYESCVYDRRDLERRLLWPTPDAGKVRR